MPRDNIGTVECPACGFPDAAVRQSVKGKSYIVCDDCGSQTFARGEKADSAIRRRMTPIAFSIEAEKPEAPKPDAPKPAASTNEFGNWLGL